jgi:hypothetical protein
VSETGRPEWLDRLYIGSTGHGDPATCETVQATGGPCRECDERVAVEAIEALLTALKQCEHTPWCDSWNGGVACDCPVPAAVAKAGPR